MKRQVAKRYRRERKKIDYRDLLYNRKLQAFLNFINLI